MEAENSFHAEAYRERRATYHDTDPHAQRMVKV